MPTKYHLPDFLDGVVSQLRYGRWLTSKARAHVNRDRKFHPNVSLVDYKNKIHQAVIQSHGKDAYTGENLDWTLLSKWDNSLAEKGGSQYKREFALLPSVDHVTERRGNSEFVICAWRTNDAKNDLSVAEFIELCRRVLGHLQSATKQ